MIILQCLLHVLQTSLQPTENDHFWVILGKFGKITPKPGLKARFLQRPTKSGVFPTASYKRPTFLQSSDY